MGFLHQLRLNHLSTRGSVHLGQNQCANPCEPLEMRTAEANIRVKINPSPQSGP